MQKKLKVNMNEDIKYELKRLKNKFRIPFRDFRDGMRNLYRWIPVIWKTKDWDRSFLLEMMIRKLRYHRDYQAKHGHIAEPRNSEIVRSMSECLELLEKVSDEWTNYEEPAIAEFEKKYGPYGWNTDKSKFSEEELKQRSEAYILYSRIAHHKWQNDLRIAMELFAEHFHEWSD
jgi:hypothetical protein